MKNLDIFQDILNLQNQLFSVNQIKFMPQTKLNALILAAGYGTRLKRVGEKTAKGLFKNKQNLSILDLILQKLNKSTHLDQIALVTNDRFFHQYQDHLQTNHPTANITLLNDDSTHPDNRLGSLGDLCFAVNQLNWLNKNLLVLPSDRTPEDIISGIITDYQKQPGSFIVAVSKSTKERIKNKSGCAVIENDQQIIEFEEKPINPKSDYLALPFYLFPKEALILLNQYKTAGNNMDSPGNIVPWLIANNFPVYAHITNKNSFDIGDLSELKEYQQNYSA